MHRRSGLVASMLALALTGAACTSASTDPEPSATPTTTSQTPTSQVTTLTVGVYGAQAERDAWERVVAAFNSASQTRRVELVTWPDHDAALRDVLAGEAPDVFMASRRDVGTLVEEQAVRPIPLLLDERGVDFGDRFSRDAVDAFSLDDQLQCMAYSVSPMVIYYNTALVDFERMAARGLEVPDEEAERWSMAEFTAAASFASRRRGVKGVWIEPTLQGLAPFIHSGGGEVYDGDEPTSLAFSDDATREALEQTLAVLRDPTLTPTNQQVARHGGLELFKRGKVAMIAGFRDLVPELRRTPGLGFDVISMPNLDGARTVGDVDGLCVSSETDDVNVAADFVAYAVSDSAVETVASTGYVVPANTHVAGSEVFLAPNLQPRHARVFNSAIRGMVVPPFVADQDALEQVVAPLLRRLVTAPGVLDLEATTTQIDEASRTVLAPEESPSESPSE